MTQSPPESNGSHLLRLFAHEVLKDVAVQTHTDFTAHLEPVITKFTPKLQSLLETERQSQGKELAALRWKVAKLRQLVVETDMTRDQIYEELCKIVPPANLTQEPQKE